MNYVLIIVWIAFLYLIRDKQIEYQENSSHLFYDNYYKQKYTFISALIAMAPLIWWSAFRGYIGDTYLYRMSFFAMPNSFGGIANYMKTVSDDKGFYLLSAVIKCLIGSNVELYLGIIAAIQAILMVKFFRRFSSDYLISVFLFIASASYIAWMFNGMRQFLAVCITLAGFKYIVESKYIRAIAVILLASTVHASAIIVLPFIFICRGKAWNWKTVLLIIVAIIVIGQTSVFNDIMRDATADTQYSDSVDNWIEMGDDGANPLRVLVNSIPALLALYGINKIRWEDNAIVNWCVNYSIVAMGINIIAMVTSGIYIGRIPIYFALQSYAIMPWLIHNIFDEEKVKYVSYAMVGFYLIYYWYSVRR